MQKYNKNPMDSSKLLSSMPESHLYDEYRNRNLHQINIHMKDHEYQMANSGVQEEDMKKANNEITEKYQKVKPNFVNNVKINT